jgi:hypothetical protein
VSRGQERGGKDERKKEKERRKRVRMQRRGKNKDFTSFAQILGAENT